MSSTRHAVLVTYGEPPHPSFLEQLTYSWRILLGLTRTVAPIPLPLVPVIAWARARARTTTWKAHGYESPLEPITERQARALAAALPALTGAEWRVHVAYEFRAPLLRDVLSSLPADEAAVVVPMYAADSAFTHELSRRVVSAMASGGPTPRHTRVLGALDVETLAAISAEHVVAHTAGTAWQGAEVALVLAAHGTLLHPRTPIATGHTATSSLCDRISARLAPHFRIVVNGWLNHTRGGKWTEPPIDVALARAAGAGCTRVVYYPYGFLADNAESELEGRMALDGLPHGVTTRHLPCLNDAPALVALLAERIAKL